jgi:hypothetical protein
MNVPDPRSVSPALWEHREAVLTWLENEQDWWRGLVIAVPLPFEVTVSVYDPTRPPKIDPKPWYQEVRLDVKRAAGPAPWTGSPFMYTWAVAEGPPGYWAATDAKAMFPYGLETDLWPR